MRELLTLWVAVQAASALLPPTVQQFGRTTARHGGRASTGDEQFKSGAGNDRDADPYAFLADADLAASYSEKDSWAEGAATLLVGVDLPGAA